MSLRKQLRQCFTDLGLETSLVTNDIFSILADCCDKKTASDSEADSSFSTILTSSELMLFIGLGELGIEEFATPQAWAICCQNPVFFPNPVPHWRSLIDHSKQPLQVGQRRPLSVPGGGKKQTEPARDPE